jgi:hypothetical protein
MDYSFIRENFDINSISKSILSIQVSLDGFSFVINDSNATQSPDYIYINSIENCNPETLTQELSAFSGFDLLEFYAIRIMVHDAFFALVPETIFDLRDMKAYLNLNHPPRLKSKALSNRIKAIQAVCVFSIDHMLYDLLKKKYPGADFCHTSLPFCKMVVEKAMDGCFIQCYEKSVELAIIKDKKLAVYNIFGLNSSDDIVYFVLNAYKSSGLDTLLDPLLISGLLQEKSDVFSLLSKYIKDIQFYSAESTMISENEGFQYPAHYFINHREILHCEL